MNADSERTSAQELKALAERLKKAAPLTEQSRDFQKAVEDLARELSEAAEIEEDMEQALAAAAASGDQEKADASAQASKIDEATIQAMKEPQGGASGLRRPDDVESGIARRSPARVWRRRRRLRGRRRWGAGNRAGASTGNDRSEQRP